MNYKILVLIIPFFCLHTTIVAQSIGPQIINAAGNSATISGNTYEWSVGELVLVNTETSANFSVTQGTLQPLIIEEDTTINIGTDPKLSANQINIFPNPTHNLVYIKPALKPHTDLYITVMDVHTRILITQKIFLETGTEQQEINLAGFAAGIYMLKVTAKEKQTQYSNTFKINKTQ